MLTADILRKFIPLHSLTEEQLSRLAKRVIVESVDAGGVVCSEGDLDHQSIYLLEGGVETRSRTSSMSRVLQAGTPDAAFPLAPGQPRPNTVVATTAARIFRIENTKVERAVLLDAVSTTITPRPGENGVFLGDREWLDEMLASAAFGSLARERVAMLIHKLEPLSLKNGEAVIRQGETGDYYYIVRQGQLSVSRKDETGKVKLVNMLKRGQVFGEEALLTGDPRNASIVAMGDCIVMRLARSDFEELLRKPLVLHVSADEAQEHMRRGAGLVDVRSVEEFQQGAIKGSFNIPLPELRLRLSQLDPVRPYVVVCRNGVQSEVAAFLMRQRGFEVFVLRNGLESVGRP